MTRATRLASLLGLALAGCGGGFIGPGDRGCDGASCDGGAPCIDGDCHGDSGIDPCDAIACPPGQRCDQGRCWTVDPCDGVVCANPGEVCDRRDGSCRAGGADDDCDGEVDEGLAPRPCRTACGDGLERCVGGRWSCSAPTVCECTPAGRVEDEPCGYCGTRSRSCRADLTWSGWAACDGEGACPAWTSGPCATSRGSSGTRSCTAGCEWGPCVPPTETCNAVDDDCDGTVDAASCLVPVYRFFDGATGDHMYEADTTAPDPGYVYEPTVFYLYRAPVPGTVAVIQRFDGVDHLVTLDPTEGDGLGYGGNVTLGFAGPAAAWTAAGMAPQLMCRYASNYDRDHMLYRYATDEELRDSGVDYTREGCPCGAGGFGWL